jgi:hypothetical protein
MKRYFTLATEASLGLLKVPFGLVKNNFNIRVLSLLQAGAKTSLVVCLTERKHQNELNSVGQFSGKVIQRHVVFY